MLRFFFVVLFLGAVAPLAAQIASPSLGATVCSAISPLCNYPVWLGSLAALSVVMSFVVAGF